MIGLALACGLVYAGVELRHLHGMPSNKQIAVDLQRALDLARTSVEAAKSATGELPPALPNAALAATVGYEARGKEYRLRAATGGIEIRIEWDGSLTTNRE